MAPFLFLNTVILGRMKSWIACIVSVAAVVFFCAVIFTFSAMPADDSTELSNGVIWYIVGFIVPGYDQLSAAEQLQWQQALQFPVRKTAHFSEYALLGALMFNMVRQIVRVRGIDWKQGKVVLVSWALSVAYCISDEVHQIFVPGRTFKLFDIGVDSVGAITGIGLLLLIIWLVRKLRKKQPVQ